MSTTIQKISGSIKGWDSADMLQPKTYSITSMKKHKAKLECTASSENPLYYELFREVNLKNCLQLPKYNLTYCKYTKIMKFLMMSPEEGRHMHVFSYLITNEKIQFQFKSTSLIQKCSQYFTCSLMDEFINTQ